MKLVFSKQRITANSMAGLDDIVEWNEKKRKKSAQWVNKLLLVVVIEGTVTPKLTSLGVTN